MSIEVWDPEAAAKPAALQQEDWQLLLELCRLPPCEALEQAAGRQHDLAWLMTLPEEAWQKAEELDTDELTALVRFFTLAEMRFAGWQAGKTSPVIAFARLLRARGAFSKELRLWIKANSDNRYLPYGSVLPGI